MGLKRKASSREVVGQFQSERRLFSEDEGTIHEVTRKKRVFCDASCDFVDRVPTIETREPQNDPLPAFVVSVFGC